MGRSSAGYEMILNGKTRRPITASTTCCFCDKPAIEGRLEKLCTDHNCLCRTSVTGLRCPVTNLINKICGEALTLGALSRGYFSCSRHSTQLSEADITPQSFFHRQLQALAIDRQMMVAIAGYCAVQKVKRKISIETLPPDVHSRHQEMLQQEFKSRAEAKRVIESPYIVSWIPSKDLHSND
jgi:hypothetical protein